MHKPVVAIVGRPNVGKSTLINRLVGARKAIVDDLPGVTRDRTYYEVTWQGQALTVVDTGGVDPDGAQAFQQKVNEQVQVALAEADVVVLVVDAQAGILALDETIAQWLRPLNKPVLVAVNKIDQQSQMALLHEFHPLGFDRLFPVSAMHGTVGVGDLLDAAVDTCKALGLDNPVTDDEEDPPLRLAFVGRPNVGKSSLVNRLLGAERCIVSDTPGTTRDAIDTTLIYDDTPYVLVDTAGIRKKAKVSYGIELFSVDRAMQSMRRADVSVLVVDATEGVTDQDKRLIEASNQAGNALLLVVNKWDLVTEKTPKSTGEFKRQVLSAVPHAAFAPVVFVSAKTGQRIETILSTARTVAQNRNRRIQTSVVNQLLMDAYTLSPPPPMKNRRLKIYYGTQVSTAPPTFLLFVNSDTLMKESYRRYLEHRLRESIDFEGTPLVLACRNKPERGKQG